MTATLQATHEAGKTVYAVAFDDPTSSDQVWDETNTQFTAYAQADWSKYAIPLTEVGIDARLYRGSWSPGKSGLFVIHLFEQAGGSPESSDKLIGNYELPYDGSDVVNLARSYDGIPWEKLQRMLVAWLAAPKTTFTDLGGGSFRYEIFAQDGSTKLYEMEFNQDGEWTSSTIQ